ncbi:unnamed protein product [Cyclocybe aegerita]|uniref:Aminoglycoside phosphotransferase domain-containing protein n=1 Tax=Cyclocybe aegerita TaxID=1973307 RepID=A0A8S0VT96_CYCAE|nr:unnamed protein product [Cyclocybe aegerita]
MEFVTRNTTIPDRRVLDMFRAIDGRLQLVQEFIDGDVLEDVWHLLAEDQRKDAMAMVQLKGYMDQLRSLQSPEPGKVQAVDGRRLTDIRIHTEEWGPFESHEDFGDFSYRGYVKRNLDKYEGTAEAYTRVKGRKRKMAFAHGDLGPHNILWKDGCIIAIIDWEFAGLFPEYWEHTRTFLITGLFPQHFPRRYIFWELYNAMVDRYPDELAVEKLLALNFDGSYI